MCAATVGQGCISEGKVYDKADKNAFGCSVGPIFYDGM